jgi:predicted acylesterase/phospholipase RssA
MSETQTVDDRAECDVVMKGGVTSGVVYPRLVAELAKKYRFRSIGGTSAGAIAAAATAAAQLGVSTGRVPDAFQRLERLPTELGQEANGRSMLLGLFQPRPTLTRPFEVLTAALNAPSRRSAVGRALVATVQRFPLGAVLGALPGFILLIQSWGLGPLVALVLLVVGGFVGAVGQALATLARELPEKGFGVCTGMPFEPREALTTWLERYLRELAGTSGDAPLTFGDLWAAPLPATGRPRDADERGIDLTMMTTGVNVGRPYRVPFESRDLYFVAEELAPYFPDTVIRWLVSHARLKSTVAAQLNEATGTKYYAMPEPADLPVIVGVRLSLSFPLLLSALPLYTVDRTRTENSRVARVPAKVYFSDGGVCSNFPVHFFDSPLPSRPTFAVNLRDDPSGSVSLPEPLENNQGVAVPVKELESETGLRGVLAFVSALLTTARTWRDEQHLTQPGFRDRIVHVGQRESEGGLNLNMAKPVIEDLANRGRLAAEKLISGFHPNGAEHGRAWDNHQRVRLRVMLAQTQRYLEQIDGALAQSTPDYRRVVVGVPGTERTYRWTPADADAAQRLLEDLARAMETLRASGRDLQDGAPRPTPELRIVPRV